MKKSNFSRNLFLKRLQTATKLFLKFIGRIFLYGFLLTMVIALQWTLTPGEFNPPKLESIFIYSTIFSFFGYIWYLYIKYFPNEIEESMKKF